MRHYELQIDAVASFDSPDFRERKNITEETSRVTSTRLEGNSPLRDKTQYHWRVRARGPLGVSGRWVSSRFFVDVSADDAFMGLVRTPAPEVRASSGANPERAVDVGDPGQYTHWAGQPSGDGPEWLEFHFDPPQTLSRIWLLSSPGSVEGRLRDHTWQVDRGDGAWTELPGARAEESDAFRRVLDFDPVEAVRARLIIERWHGRAPRVHNITFYSPGAPSPPRAPSPDYVLIIGNQHDGGTLTDLEARVRTLAPELEVLLVPYYEASMRMLESLSPRPVAVILSGNGASYHMLPMFEFNGELEIIRQSRIPLLGICCGHQLFAMAECRTHVRHMGWADVSMRPDSREAVAVEIVKEDPILRGVAPVFISAQEHNHEIAVLPDEFEVLAASSHIEIIRSKTRPMWGLQIHAELDAPHNQAQPILKNFLDLAREWKRTKESHGESRGSR
jgi:GMP synthase-like glutamine amidotransferase